MIDQFFVEIGVIIISATLLAYFTKKFNQPSIVAYIIAGIIIGPGFLGIIENQSVIDLFSELGVLFLLFIVGTEMDLSKLKEVGSSPLFIGFGELIIVGGVTFIVSRNWFGFVPSLYLSVCVALSSTVMVVKLLMDEDKLYTLYGRTGLGVLLVQDFIAVLVLMFFPSMGSFTVNSFVVLILKGLGLLLLAVFASLSLLPYIIEDMASDSLELLSLASLAWAFVVSLAANYIGLSTVIGAFIAGLTLGNTDFSWEISSRIKPLRDFFITIFFVSLGMHVTWTPFTDYLIPLILFCSIALLFKPLIMFVISQGSGQHERTSFLTGTSLAQISEFSLVIVTLGFSLGHVSRDIVGLVALVAAFTMAVSSYFIIYDRRLYSFFEPVFPPGDSNKDLEYDPEESYDVVLCGHRKIGNPILKKIFDLGKNVLVIDYDPNTIKRLISEGVPALYGDVSDDNIIDHMNLESVEALISTIPKKQDNIILLKRVREVNSDAFVVVTAKNEEDALELYDRGADYVLVPDLLGGEEISSLLDDLNKDELGRFREEHIRELKKRIESGNVGF